MGEYFFYETDLAYVHDTGYGNFARQAATMLKELFNRAFPEKGLILDLGCGSGIVAKELLENHFQVLGIDRSAALIEIAKKKAPAGSYLIGSFYEIPLPKCKGVISTSECLNYATSDKHEGNLKQLFQNVFDALERGGLFVFDMVEPGGRKERHEIVEGADWTMFIHEWEDSTLHLLTKEITLFRQMGELYRKSREVHQARLYPHEKIVSLLEGAGFHVSLFKQYGNLPLDSHHFGYHCKKS